MRFHLAEKIFNYLYGAVDGYAIAEAAKEKLGAADRTLTYGEITLPALHGILAALPLTEQHKIFYDLGSGTGKAVMGMSLLGDFSYSYGIELLTDLCQAAKRQLAVFNEDVVPLLPTNWHTTNTHFINGDFLQHNFSDGDVLFLNSTCFSNDMLQNIEKRLTALKIGSLVISLSISFRNPYFDIVHFQKFPMSWGDATVFIHRKIM